MNIVMFSINPLFADYVMGGAPKHLQNIALYLGEQGHDVTILCTQLPGNDQSFQWHERVIVKPLLRFHQPFPQPYASPAYNLAAALQDMGDHLARADRFYMHDGEFLFPYTYRHIPTVVSLRDNVYPETILGSFLFQGDRLILISEYSRQYYLTTVGRFLPGLADRIDVIHNGIDWNKFKPTVPDRILDIIPIMPGKQPIILHPHRPEESKGIRQTIAVVDLLVHRHGISDVIALAPRWLDLQLTTELHDFYAQIEMDINQRGLSHNFLFHDWIPQNLMPEYYSLGDVTLSLGHFVESFGNAVYESMGCGTPTVASRISTHRELVPDALMDKVDFGDIEKAAELAAAIIREKRRTSPPTLQYLHDNYSIEQQLQSYARVIMGATKLPELSYYHSSIGKSTRYQLAPWCYVTERGVYHDFLAEYRPLTEFLVLFENYATGFTVVDAERLGVSHQTLLSAYRDGFLVPTLSGL